MAELIPVVDDWPEQQTRGHRIPGERYTSREFFAREWEGMWTRVWLLLGREAELPNPGDWQMEPVGAEEILMVRQQDGSINPDIDAGATAQALLGLFLGLRVLTRSDGNSGAIDSIIEQARTMLR